MNFVPAKCVYYFDRITVNFRFPVEQINALARDLNLSSLCERLWVGEASNTGKYHGYLSKIDAYDATDEFLRNLATYEFPHDTANITYIEIAKDLTFETMKKAGIYLFKMERNQVRNWEREGKRFLCEDTVYRGKAPGIFSRSYDAMYSPPEDSKIVHHEFRIVGKRNVARLLGNNQRNYSAKELYEMLENKYIPPRKINSEKLLKTFCNGGMNPEYAEKRVEHIKTYLDLVEYIKRLQRQVLHRKMRAAFQGRRFRSRNFDKMVMSLEAKQFMCRTL